MSARPVPPQLAILWVALCVGTAAGASSLGAWLASYAVSWLAINALVARKIELPRMRWQGSAATSLLLVIACWPSLERSASALAGREMLSGLDVHLMDRLALESAPAIHPRVVSIDRRQTFFVHAPSAARVRVAFGDGAAIDGESLGHGVFRVDFEPLLHAPSAGDPEGLARIDVDGGRHERTVAIVSPPAHPRWLRASPDRARACVTSEETDEVVIITEADHRRIRVEGAPSDCAILDPGRVAVALRDRAHLAIVDSSAGIEIDRVEIGEHQHRLLANGTLLVAALETGEIVLIDSTSLGERGRLSVGGVPDGLVMTGERMVIARRAPAALLSVSLDPPRVEDERALLAPAVAMSADERSVLLATTDWSEDGTPHLGNHFIQDQIVALDPRSLVPLERWTTAERSPRQDLPGSLDRGISPMGLAPSANGGQWIAFAGSAEIAHRSPGGLSRWIDAGALGLSAPTSIVELAGGSIAVSSAADGLVVVLDPRGHERARISLAPDDAELARAERLALTRRRGERAFYEATRAGISCQSCHLYGASDGRTHNIGGRRLVPTLDVRGSAGTAPYLRDGSYARLRDLHRVSLTVYRGYRDDARPRAAPIEAWITAQPVPRSLAPRRPESEQRGLDAMARAGCLRCHAPPAFTNLGRHITRSLFPDSRGEPGASVDTPSLRGSARRPRLLFDGRARSVREVLEVSSRGGRHGDVAALSARDLADVVAFLESL